MGLSAGPAERRVESYANTSRDTGSRKPLMPIISAAIASLVIGSAIMAGAAMLNYQPVQQHVQFEIAPRTQ